MRRILFVCNHLYGGGAERVLVSLANYFCNKGNEVVIAAYDTEKTYPLDSKVKIVKVNDSDNRIKVIKNIRGRIKETQPDVVISFEYYVNICTILACIGLKPRLIISERNDPAIVGAKFPNGIIRDLTYRLCDVLVCQTYDAKEYFSKSIQKKSVVILNPLKDDLPHRWENERECEIVNFCRLNEQKNIPLLIDAFELFLDRNPSYRLSIFGNGELKENLENYIKEKELSGKVTIYAARNDIHERIIKSAMFVSSSDYEGLSNSMLEAMAIGIPTISTDCPCGGARMVIDDGVNGLLVPVGDKNCLAEKMNDIAANRELAEKLSYNSSKLREQLSLDVIAMQWESCFINRG